MADQPVAAIEGQQHLAQRLLAAGVILGGQGIFTVDAQHRQRGAQFVGGLVGELLLPLYGVRQGVHQAVDLRHQGRQLLGLDGQVERAQVGGMALADCLGELIQWSQPPGDQPPQQAEQEGQGDEERQHGQGGHLAGQLPPLVIPLRDYEPGVLILVVEGEGAPLVVILGLAVEAALQGGQGLLRRIGRAQQYGALLVEQLEVEVVLELVAVGGELVVPPQLAEAALLLMGVGGHGLLPLLVDGPVAGQFAALLQITAEQLVGDAGGLGETGIEQLFHLVVGFQVADEAADGQAEADQGQDAGEQEAANGADATHRAGIPLLPGVSGCGTM